MQVHHRSTYQVLTQDEWDKEENIKEHMTSMESAHQRFGPQDMVKDLIDLGEEDTSLYDPYENNCWNEETFSKIKEELKEGPELETTMLTQKFNSWEWTIWQEAELLATSMIHMATSLVNPKGVPILDTCLYEFEHTGRNSQKQQKI